MIHNYIGGKFIPSTSTETIPVINPANGVELCRCPLSNADDVAQAIAIGKEVFQEWKSTTIKQRTSIMLKFYSLVNQHAQELAEIIVRENGKNITEALADVAKGNETVEWACSLPQLAPGRLLEVSRGIECCEYRDPLGVVACIVPFNFPVMVPMWTFPIALVMGNCVILKPSEKVPSAMQRIVELLAEAGLPAGVMQLVHGGQEVVKALTDAPVTDIAAVSFVGSSKVASIVFDRCNTLKKRVIALGGAKNHLIATPDCDIGMASRDIVASFAGCSGQRCMAASVLLLTSSPTDGPNEHAKLDELLSEIIRIARDLKPGQNSGQVGPVIDTIAVNRILSYIDEAVTKDGAEILLDGRTGWSESTTGNWIGPTILLHRNSNDRAMREEIFGPVLSVYRASSWNEAITIENSNPYGNAACIYTEKGAVADWFTTQFRAAMLGVNIGIPVPREPFSFGGLYGTDSKYGNNDITGDGAMEFFSSRRKVTRKWTSSYATNSVSSNTGSLSTSSSSSSNSIKKSRIETNDAASFDGKM